MFHFDRRFRVFDKTVFRWPQFTASVTFELFKKKAATSQANFRQTLVGGTSPIAPGAKREEHCELPVASPINTFKF